MAIDKTATNSRPREIKPAIIFDVDGVIVDWLGAFGKWMGQRKGLVPKVQTRLESSYAMTDCWPELHSGGIVPYIEEFNVSDDYAAIEPLEEVVEVIRAARAEFPTHQIVALSSCGTHPKTVYGRAAQMRWLELDELRILPLHAPKTAALADYLSPGTVMFEDSPSHAAQVIAAGHEVILVDQSYNRAETRFPRMRSWDQALPMLRQAIARRAAA